MVALELLKHKDNDKDDVYQLNDFIAECEDITNFDQLTEIRKVRDRIEEVFSNNLETSNEDDKSDNSYMVNIDFLSKAIFEKEVELTRDYRNQKDDNNTVNYYAKQVQNLEWLAKDIDALNKIMAKELDSLSSKFDLKDVKKMSMGGKILLLLSSYIANKFNKKITATLLLSYMSVKCLKDLLTPTKDTYLELFKTYNKNLEGYLFNATDIKDKMTTNLNEIIFLERSLREKYKAYLKEEVFVTMFTLIDNIKNSLNEQLKDLDNTKDAIENNISKNKVKIKMIEG